MLNKRLLVKLLFFLLPVIPVKAQYALEGSLSSSGKNLRFTNMFAKVEDSLKKELKEKGFQWPAKYMYVRAFKHEKQLEVWLKNDWAETFQLFKG